MDFITQQFQQRAELIEQTRINCSPQISQIIDLICQAFKSGNKLLLMGNGGSAADCQHMAAEFVGRFERERAAWPAIALTTDTSILTAIGNDYGYDHVFSRQIEALANPGDVVFGISTSGNSVNVVRGFEAAIQKGSSLVALTGGHDSRMSELAQIAIQIPAKRTASIQEMHLFIEHLICAGVELAMVKEGDCS